MYRPDHLCENIFGNNELKEWKKTRDVATEVEDVAVVPVAFHVVQLLPAILVDRPAILEVLFDTRLVRWNAILLTVIVW